MKDKDNNTKEKKFDATIPSNIKVSLKNIPLPIKKTPLKIRKGNIKIHPSSEVRNMFMRSLHMITLSKLNSSLMDLLINLRRIT